MRSPPAVLGRLQISALVLLFSAGLAAVFPILMASPRRLVRDARESVLIIGVTTRSPCPSRLRRRTCSSTAMNLQNLVILIPTTIRVVGVVCRSPHRAMASVAIAPLRTRCDCVKPRAHALSRPSALIRELESASIVPAAELSRKYWTYRHLSFLNPPIAVRLVLSNGQSSCWSVYLSRLR